MKAILKWKIKKAWLYFALLLTYNSSSQVYIFSNAGATGSLGPTQTQLNLNYANTNLNNTVISNQGIQSWTVPASGPYKISALGARGAGNGGYGALMEGNFNLIAGQVLQIVVGQQGENGIGTNTVNNSGGGGGGSFIVLGIDSLFIAAGGGGAGLLNTIGGNASTITLGGSTIWNGGGDNGNGGYSGITNGDAAGGGGFYTNGGNSYNSAQTICEGGKSFLNGATGGASGVCGNYYGGAGGFGGGGSGWHNGINRGGAGGGYSGGQGGTLSAIISGGGGGSYNVGSDQTNQEGVGSENGSVKIILLKSLNVEPNNGTLGTGSITKIGVTTKLDQTYVDVSSTKKLFPNPNNGYFQIESANNSKVTDYTIYSSEGKLICKKTSIDTIVSFDITGFPCGVYYIKEENHKVLRFVKNK